VRLVSALEELEPRLEPRFLLARKHRPTSGEVPARWPVAVALPPDYFFYMRGPRFWISAALAIAKAARAARSCDLVHAIKDYPHSWIALRAAELAGKPCIATAHGTYSVQPLLEPAPRGARARLLPAFRGADQRQRLHRAPARDAARARRTAARAAARDPQRRQRRALRRPAARSERGPGTRTPSRSRSAS